MQFVRIYGIMYIVRTTRYSENMTVLGSAMYNREYTNQMRIEDFAIPFGGKLNPENRWVKLAEITPWEKIEDYYAKVMCNDSGRGAFTARIAFGAIYIKESEKLSDEATVTYIQENPYVQYYLGLPSFKEEALFDSSMMVHFRKRFPVDFIGKVNEYICTGKWPEEKAKIDRNDDDNNNGSAGTGGSAETSESSEPVENKGTLIMDATVAPADIKFPTDIDLLNQSREHLEKAISLLWPCVDHSGHKFPYNTKKARKSFLNISKSKKWTRKKLRKAIEDQLRYVELAAKRLEEMKVAVPGWEEKFPSWLKQRLEVIPVVYSQQKQMLETGTHTCDDRIVSLSQPHVRPIVRGKRPNPTEFGQKIHLSVVDGYTFIEQTSWNAYNESTYLKDVTEEYLRKFGCYPTAILADKIYQSRTNREYCRTHGIRLSGPALGRPKAGKEAEEKAQMYQDACDRNVVEGRNGNLKRKYGLNLIMSKLDETAKTEAALAILVMNSWRRIQEILLRLFYIWLKSVGGSWVLPSC